MVPNVYYHYCGYGAMPISSTHERFNIETKHETVINSIVESKRCLDPWLMVAETHKPNGAWDKIYK